MAGAFGSFVNAASQKISMGLKASPYRKRSFDEDFEDLSSRGSPALYDKFTRKLFDKLTWNVIHGSIIKQGTRKAKIMMGKDPGGDIVVHRSIADHTDDAIDVRAAASGPGGAIADAISKSTLIDGFKKTLEPRQSSEDPQMQRLVTGILRGPMTGQGTQYFMQKMGKDPFGSNKRDLASSEEGEASVDRRGSDALFRKFQKKLERRDQVDKLVWNGISGALNKQGTMWAERKMGKDHTAFEGSHPNYNNPRDLVTANNEVEAAGYVARAGTYPDGSSDLLSGIEVRHVPDVTSRSDGGDVDAPQERDEGANETLSDRASDESTTVERDDDEEEEDKSLSRRSFDDLDASAAAIEERQEPILEGTQEPLEARMLRNPFTGQYYGSSSFGSDKSKSSPPASPPRQGSPARAKSPARSKSPARAASPARGRSPTRAKSPARYESPPPPSAERLEELRFARAARANSAAQNAAYGKSAKSKLSRREESDNVMDFLGRSFIDGQSDLEMDAVDKRLSTAFALKTAWKHGMPMAKKFVVPAAKKFGPKYAKMAMKHGKPLAGKFAKNVGPKASTYGAKFAGKFGPKASLYGSKFAAKFGPAAQKYAGPTFTKYGGKFADKFGPAAKKYAGPTFTKYGSRFAEKFAVPWGKSVGAKFKMPTVFRRDLSEESGSQLTDGGYIASRAPIELEGSRIYESPSPALLSRGEGFEAIDEEALRQRGTMSSGAWWLAKKTMLNNPAGMGLRGAWWLGKKVVGKGSSKAAVKGLEKGAKKGTKSSSWFWRRQTAPRAGRVSDDENDGNDAPLPPRGVDDSTHNTYALLERDVEDAKSPYVSPVPRDASFADASTHSTLKKLVERSTTPVDDEDGQVATRTIRFKSEGGHARQPRRRPALPPAPRQRIVDWSRRDVMAAAPQPQDQSYISVRQAEPHPQHQGHPISPDSKPQPKPQPKPDPKPQSKSAPKPPPPPQRTAWQQTVRYAKVTKDALVDLAGCNIMGSFNVWTYCKPIPGKRPMYDEAGMWPV
ncbi:hypothetical protein BCV69DRAFT_283252 [Microstroma glucosiphilum]|uniref:Uncharacterized protein n=1 Tax=Pseudomicrostroma glucosiphilum TaxID=1684307 RepID=A0A316U569_9BASI|nr:hypothetical protein BCV69DRAFT_283252 [Pseudomicrostroma glucosiphilum]PWN20376.1 hypothetical protein BCV69DRAFT_283252 [Pseudomicrostroma glucosiphilum]